MTLKNLAIKTPKHISIYLKTVDTIPRHANENNSAAKALFFFHKHFSLGCMRKERFWWEEVEEGEEEEVGVLFGGGESEGSIRMRPTSTQHTIRPVLHFANLYPGCWFRVFPWKKRKRVFFFFQVSVCFHEQEWLRLTNKPLFPSSQMQALIYTPPGDTFALFF